MTNKKKKKNAKEQETTATVENSQLDSIANSSSKADDKLSIDITNNNEKEVLGELWDQLLSPSSTRDKNQ
jgi:hypothetical protein